MNEHKVYLDNAATTSISNEVLKEMMPYLTENYGNTNSLHSFGRNTAEALTKARDRVAEAIGANANEIYFTSGGTEANNWAIIGIAEANQEKGKHIITSQIEHSSVLSACKVLESRGFKVTYLPVDKYGLVSMSELMQHLTRETILVSIMSANNEIGTIQSINAIASIAKERGSIFHTDCVQATGLLDINVNNIQIDAMTISSHKLHGPKGAGALYIRRGVKIAPLIIGGSQEHNLRAGTINTPAIVGFGVAISIAKRDLDVNVEKITKLRNYFINRILTEIEDTSLNGHPNQRLANNISITFNNINGEALLIMLDMAGIAVSTGSACSVGSTELPYTLLALKLTLEQAKSTIRFSLDVSTSKEEIDYTMEKLIVCVKKLRTISPLVKIKGGK